MNNLKDAIERLKKNEKYGERERVLLDNFAAAEPIEFTVTLDGQPLKVTGWEGIVYETEPIPVDTEHTFGMGRSDDPYGWYKLSLWVPENAPEDAPIIYRVRNGGWHNFALSKDRPFVAHGGTYSSTDTHDAVGKALSMGCAIVESGARGRMLDSQDGRHIGKAPAVIVDTKAAIRFLRLIDPLIKPSAERIVVTGTSGGGALSVITAASGNASEFNDLLLKAGAAGIGEDGSSFIRDDVFGTIAYCPIIDLGHADMAYAWQYRQARLDQNEKKPGTWSEETLRASEELAGKFGDYVASLGLKNDDGEPITIDNLKDEVEKLLIAGADIRAEGNPEIPPYGENFAIENINHMTRERTTTYLLNDWITLDPETGKTATFDYRRFLDFVADTQRLKDDPAFDQSGYRRISGPPNAMWDPGESNLFGGEDIPYTLFTEYSWMNADKAIDGVGFKNTGLTWQQFLETEAGELVQRQIRTVSPFSYLNDPTCDSAPYFYVRHGLRDRDTSFAIETLLCHAMRNDKTIRDVNFRFYYMINHAGDYDVQEAYAWLADKLREAGEGR